MADPITIGILLKIILAGIGKAIAVGALIVVITIVELALDRIASWMQAHKNIKTNNRNSIAFSILEKLNTGEYQTVYGIFDTNTNNVLAGEIVKSERVTPEIAYLHRDELVVYSG